MPHVSREDIEKFERELDKAYHRLGGGKLGVESDLVRAAVRIHKAAAYRYVEIHCIAAASQPGYLQPAMMLATAYQVEFDDATLVELVGRRARELNATEHLDAIGFAPTAADLKAEPQEREAARQWWKSSPRNDGICDSCRTPLKRGEGYLIDGRLMMFGASKINLGIEVLCPKCFHKYRWDPRDPGAKGDDYVRIG